MLKLKGSYMVRPAEPTPEGKAYLSYFDQLAPITHVPTIYFYPPGSSFSFASAMETLKSSLSQALVHFYPLAGRLHWDGTGGRLELDCNAMGARFYEYESQSTIDDFGDFAPTPELRELAPLVDYDAAPLPEIPLLLVQLTKFRCGGISLGIGLSHVIVDGTSKLHFISNWARIARGAPLDDVAPFLDRTVLKARVPLSTPRFDHVEYGGLPLLIGQLNDYDERRKETTVAMLHLTKAQVDKLKNMANVNRASEIRAYTKYEAVAGHLWKCTCKARGHKKEQLTKLSTVVNVRNRMQPSLPRGYFGNALISAVSTSQAGELILKPLSYASAKIREAIDNITDEYVKSSIGFLINQQDINQFRSFNTVKGTQGTFSGNPNLDVTSWSSLPLYGVDFGWGKEIYMGPGGIGSDGKCFILPGHDEDGSIAVALKLQVAHMQALRECFYEDII